MTQFGRRFDRLDVLENVLSGQNHWWRDLLTLWRPSGQATGDDGLRLAIRDGYMNFYRRGQSVARVGFNKDGQPALSVHAKYVLPDADQASVQGQEYVTLTTASVVSRTGRPVLPYKGIETLKGWVRSAEKYAGEEKEFVDDLLSVPANDGVIDLEMGLPAWRETERVAPRMDLVSVNQVDGRLVIFFGEVKLVADKRLRCQAPLQQDKMPEVLRQLSEYRKYLAEPAHRALIGQQYSNAARLMKRLRGMADTIGPVRPLGRTILGAAEGKNLDVAELARLIVCEKGATKSWAKHRTKLEAERERAPMIVLDAPAALHF
jgi:hypothetical protein